MLRMTKQADYGIVLLSYMARRSGERYSASELSGVSQLPLPTVSKILKLLAKEALLVSHRGVHGGYSLASDPEEISVAAMIAALDGPIAFTECIEDTPGACDQESNCSLRGNWQRINQAVRDALEGISLADLAQPIPFPLIQLGGHHVRAIEKDDRPSTAQIATGRA